MRKRSMFWRNSHFLYGVVILLVIGIIGLSQQKQQPDFAIQGEIMTISAQSDGGVTIRVEQTPTSPSLMYNRASIKVSTDIPIWRGQAMILPSELAVGMEVAVVFTGPVAESDPVQAQASYIKVIE